MARELRDRDVPAGPLRKQILAAIAFCAALLALALCVAGPSAERAAEPREVALQEAPREHIPASRAPVVQRAGERGAAAQLAFDGVRPPPAWILRGRCVDASTRAPLGGCRVLFDHWDFRMRWSGQPEPRSCTSDAAGSFELDLGGNMSSCGLELRRDGYATLAGALPELEDAPLDLGELPFQRGSRIRGSIVDEGGARVEGAVLCASGPAERIPGWGECPVAELARSGSDGCFEFAGGFLAGTWKLEERSELELALVEPASFEMRGEDLDLLVRVRRLSAIRGRVVDEVGSPIARAEIVTRPCEHDKSARALTDEAGLFALEPPCARCAKAHLRIVPGTAEEIEIADVAWGSTELEILARRSIRLEIRVTAEDTGAAVESFGIFFSQSEEEPTIRDVRELGEHPGGVLQLDVPRGRYRLSVWPEEAKLQMSEPEWITVEDGAATRLHVLLSPQPRLALRVTDASGHVVAGALIEVLQPLPREGSPIALPARVLAHENTDEHGMVEIHGLPLREEFAVRVRSPQYAMLLQEGLVLKERAERRELVLQRGPLLRGRLEPKELAALGATLHFAPSLEATRIEVALDGSFELENAPPGKWPIWLRVLDAFSVEPIATLEIAPEAPAFAALDATLWAPVPLSGGVTVNGCAARAIWLVLRRVEPLGLGRPQTISLDVKGAFFRRVEILPGRYAAVVQLVREASTDRNIDLELDRDLEIAGGAACRLDLALELQSRSLRLVDALKKPLAAETRVEIETPRGLAQRKVSVGEDGIVELAPAPLVPFALRVGSRRAPREGWISSIPDGEVREVVLSAGR